jgi:hypothetical protein
MCQLRGIKAVFQSAAKDKGADTLSDEECIAVLRKLAKQVLSQRTLFTCFTGTRGECRWCCASWRNRYSVYLLYWYKSTNIDACRAAATGEH